MGFLPGVQRAGGEFVSRQRGFYTRKFFQQMTVRSSAPSVSPQEIRRIIREELRPHFDELAQSNSTAELRNSPRYKGLERLIELVLERPETGSFATRLEPRRQAYRIVSWNLERGIHFEGQLEAFRSHPYLRRADVLLLTETDVGMARSGNRAVAQELASALQMHYGYASCYLNLAKGAGIETDAAGENELGLHGNAILSRYPLCHVRAIPLQNGKDKMRGREKRLGCQAAVAAEVRFPQGPVTMVAVHLDANSSQQHRRNQMAATIAGIENGAPAVIGGDWNTTTFDSSSAARAIAGFWIRVAIGPGEVIRNHFLRPYARFEKDLFDLLEAQGFDYRRANVEGERTTSYDVADVKTHKNLREWVPAWCFDYIRWALRKHDGQCPLKIDWFATRGLECSNPTVLHEFREGRTPPLSDHDAIGLDIRLENRA